MTEGKSGYGELLKAVMVVAKWEGNYCPSCGIRMTAAEANASGHHHLAD